MDTARHLGNLALEVFLVREGAEGGGAAAADLSKGGEGGCELGLQQRRAQANAAEQRVSCGGEREEGAAERRGGAARPGRG